jgi:hypothetical protein
MSLHENIDKVARRFPRVQLYQDWNLKVLCIGVPGEKKYWESGFVAGTRRRCKAKVQRTLHFMKLQLSQDHSYADEAGMRAALDIAWAEAAKVVDMLTRRSA